MDRFDKSLEMTFTLRQYGNEYTIHNKYWHSDPPEMDLGIDFFLNAMELLGWDKQNVQYYFYDIVKDEIERNRKDYGYDTGNE